MKHSHVEIFEDERASQYDQFVKTWIVNYDFVLQTIPSIVQLKSPDARDILVVGSGTGNEMLALLHAKNTSWNVTGVDPSPDMVEMAKQKLKGYSEASLVLGDVHALPHDRTFDVATLLLVLHFMKDDGTKQSLLQGIHDKLSEGAPLIILDIFGDDREFAQNIRILEKILPEVVEGMVIKDRIETMGERIYHISEDRLSDLLQQVGFSKPVRFFQSVIYGAWITTKK